MLPIDIGIRSGAANHSLPLSIGQVAERHEGVRHVAGALTIIRNRIVQYAILVYETPSELAAREDPSRAPAYWAAYTAYAQALAGAGVAVGGAGLHPPSMATTVRLRGGQQQVQDGPFADTKELLGGLFLIDVPTLDEALVWAARCPAAATGSVEVRPQLPPPPSPSPA